MIQHTHVEKHYVVLFCEDLLKMFQAIKETLEDVSLTLDKRNEGVKIEGLQVAMASFWTGYSVAQVEEALNIIGKKGPASYGKDKRRDKPFFSGMSWSDDFPGAN